MKKPAIPTFGAGIVVAFIIGIVTQGADPIEMLNAMSKGVSMETGIPIVNTLVNRGGIVSMLDTIGLILSAAIFAAPMRASGSVNAIFEAVKKVAKTPTQFMVLALIMQPVLLVATTSYFVTMPVTGELAADGIYGSGTEASVRAFQSVFGLPQTGVVDFATWYKISHIYVGISRIAELN